MRGRSGEGRIKNKLCFEGVKKQQSFESYLDSEGIKKQENENENENENDNACQGWITILVYKT